MPPQVGHVDRLHSNAARLQRQRLEHPAAKHSTDLPGPSQSAQKVAKLLKKARRRAMPPQRDASLPKSFDRVQRRLSSQKSQPKLEHSGSLFLRSVQAPKLEFSQGDGLSVCACSICACLCVCVYMCLCVCVSDVRAYSECGMSTWLQVCMHESICVSYFGVNLMFGYDV